MLKIRKMRNMHKVLKMRKEQNIWKTENGGNAEYTEQYGKKCMFVFFPIFIFFAPQEVPVG